MHYAHPVEFVSFIDHNALCRQRSTLRNCEARPAISNNSFARWHRFVDSRRKRPSTPSAPRCSEMAQRFLENWQPSQRIFPSCKIKPRKLITTINRSNNPAPWHLWNDKRSTRKKIGPRRPCRRLLEGRKMARSTRHGILRHHRHLPRRGQFHLPSLHRRRPHHRPKMASLSRSLIR